MEIEINVRREAPGDIKHRKNIRNLRGEDLANLREAFRKVVAINDPRGYQHHAGIHALPLPAFCQHGNMLFLPWHRAYLYFFELALQDQVPGVTIPWWDWTSEASRDEGIPEAYSAPTIDDQDNPLYKAPIADLNDRLTLRDPGNPSDLTEPDDVEDILEAPNFYDFWLRLEDVHNFIHVWVGGHMGAVPYAAYDPIFWSHHAMIDRLWYLWQLRNPNAGPSPADLNRALAPFEMIVAEIMDVNELGYDYASAEVLVA